MLSDWLSAGATSAAAIVGAGALVFTWLQVREIKDQSALTSKAAVSQAYGQISNQMGAINAIFRDHPDWIPYFYSDVEPRPGKFLQSTLEVFCESLMDFVDSVSEQRTATPHSDMDWSTWDAYFRFMYNASPVLRGYVLDNIDYYPDYVLAALGLIIVRNSWTGAQRGAWHAREVDLSDPADRALVTGGFGEQPPAYVAATGYPWVRTWVIGLIGDETSSKVVVAVEVCAGTTLARVHVRWAGPPDTNAIPTLRSWVLGTLTASSRITRAEVHNGIDPVTTYGIKPPSIDPDRERFLIPLFVPVAPARR